MEKEVNICKSFIEYLPIIISIIVLIYTIRALRNGLRENIYEKQITSLQKLISIAVEFAQIIDYSHPSIIRNKIGELDSKENIEKMVTLYLSFDKGLHENKFLLPKKITYLLTNQNFQMSSVLNSIKTEHFEQIRTRYFDNLNELEILINKKLNIKRLYRENKNL